MNVEGNPVHREEGIIWIVGSCLTGAGGWFLEHLNAINNVLHFLILGLTLYGLIIGLKKVRKSASPAPSPSC